MCCFASLQLKNTADALQAFFLCDNTSFLKVWSKCFLLNWVTFHSISRLCKVFQKHQSYTYFFFIFSGWKTEEAKIRFSFKKRRKTRYLVLLRTTQKIILYWYFHIFFKGVYCVPCFPELLWSEVCYSLLTYDVGLVSPEFKDLVCLTLSIHSHKLHKLRWENKQINKLHLLNMSSVFYQSLWRENILWADFLCFFVWRQSRLNSGLGHGTVHGKWLNWSQ